MTDKHNTEKITPESLTGIEINDDLQVTAKRPPQKDISQETNASSTDSTKLESEPGTNARAKSEQNDAALEVAQRQEPTPAKLESGKDNEDGETSRKDPNLVCGDVRRRKRSMQTDGARIGHMGWT